MKPRHSRQCHYIAAYLRRHLAYIRAWDRQGTLEWVRWFIAHGRCLSITDGNQLVGVSLVRLVDEPGQAHACYCDTGGHIAYIEVTACERGNMPYLFTLFRQTFPQADKMAWMRAKYGNRPVITTIKAAEKLFHAHV